MFRQRDMSKRSKYGEVDQSTWAGTSEGCMPNWPGAWAGNGSPPPLSSLEGGSAAQPLSRLKYKELPGAVLVIFSRPSGESTERSIGLARQGHLLRYDLNVPLPRPATPRSIEDAVGHYSHLTAACVRPQTPLTTCRASKAPLTTFRASKARQTQRTDALPS